MSYNYTVKAVSLVNGAIVSYNECFYADGVSSQKDGICTDSTDEFVAKGRKHIFSVYNSHRANEAVCSYLNDVLLKKYKDRKKIMVQYFIKDIVGEIQSMCSSDDEICNMSMLYIDGDNIYGGGFGDINIFRYSEKKNEIEKLNLSENIGDKININSSEFIAVANAELSTAPRVRFIDKLWRGDEYLILGRDVSDTLSYDKIRELFAGTSENVLDAIEKESLDQKLPTSVNGIHISVNNSVSPYIIWMMLIFIVATVLGLIIYFM